jgi:hypothetical protein
MIHRPGIVGGVIEPMRFLDLDLERSRLIGSLIMSKRQCAVLLLVGGKASSTTTVATTIATSSREAASTLEAASATAESTTTTTTAHARNIGALGGNLDAAALEHALVKNEGLGDQAGLGELDVGIARNPVLAVFRNGRKSSGAYPFGCPVNLSSRMVTRLMEPQLSK